MVFTKGKGKKKYPQLLQEKKRGGKVGNEFPQPIIDSRGERLVKTFRWPFGREELRFFHYVGAVRE